MANTLTLKFEADLSVAIDSATCPSSATDAGCFYSPAIRDKNSSAALDAGSKIATIASPASFEALPWPSTLLARVIYVKPHGTSSTYILRITYATTGTVDIPLAGMVLLEAASDDAITGLAIQGDVSVEWGAWGGTT